MAITIQKSWQCYHMAARKSLTVLPYSFTIDWFTDKLGVWLWQQKIIDNSLVWLSPIEYLKKWSWQFYYMAVTNHWQIYYMAVVLQISLTIILCSSTNRWQTSHTALTALTNVLYGCHQSLTNVWCGHEPQSWQNYCKTVDKITVTPNVGTYLLVLPPSQGWDENT